MVAWPSHVPDEFHTSQNAEHVELHDTTTDALVDVQAQVDGITFTSLAGVTIPVGIQPGWIAVRADDGTLTFIDPALLPAGTVLCD
jgi:hypothetical protein